MVKVNLRSHSPDVRKLLLDGVERTARTAAQRAKAPEPTFRYLGGTGAVVSDPALANRLATVLKPLFAGRLFLIPEAVPPAPSSEDFSEFIDAGVPSVFFGIGSYDPAMIADYAKRGAALPVNHSPYFQPQPAPSIRTSVTVLTLAVLEVAGVK